MCPSGAVLPLCSAGCAYVWTRRTEKSEGERKLVVPDISKTLRVLTPSRRICREKSSFGQCSAAKRAQSVLCREESSVGALDGTPLPGNKAPHNLAARNNKRVSRLWLSWVALLSGPGLAPLGWVRHVPTVHWQVSWGLTDLDWPRPGCFSWRCSLDLQQVSPSLLTSWSQDSEPVGRSPAETQAQDSCDATSAAVYWPEQVP